MVFTLWAISCLILTCVSLSSLTTTKIVEAFSTDAPSSSLPPQIRLRPAYPDDELPISLIMAKELMNPSISHRNNMIVAEDTASGHRIGWAQIRSLGYATTGVSNSGDQYEDGDNTSSLNSRKVQSISSIEEDVDEEMWEDFDDDPTPIPNGWASLPWTKEYKNAMQSADDRIKRREMKLQLELEARPKFWELSSVYVRPQYRDRGVGSALVNAVLQRHITTRQRGKDIYALTLASTATWYEKKFGFRIVEEKHQIPNAMTMAKNIGSAITQVKGDELVCIRKII